MKKKKKKLKKNLKLDPISEIENSSSSEKKLLHCPFFLSLSSQFKSSTVTTHSHTSPFFKYVHPLPFLLHLRNFSAIFRKRKHKFYPFFPNKLTGHRPSIYKIKTNKKFVPVIRVLYTHFTLRTHHYGWSELCHIRGSVCL